MIAADAPAIIRCLLDSPPAIPTEVPMRVIGPIGIVETARLRLRPCSEDDAGELQRLFSNPAVRGDRNLPSDRIAKFAEASLRQWRVNGFGPWAAIDRATGCWIGQDRPRRA